jgi:hypothetical protein
MIDDSTLQVATSILLGLLSIFTIVGNYAIALTRRGSLLPLVGGISGALAILLWPAPGARMWFWVPLLVDLGSLPILSMTLVRLIRRHGAK